MGAKVLVYGFYHKGNAGDDLFIEAFKKLFPQLQLAFTDMLTPENLSEVSAVFLGGGSFLDGDPLFSPATLEILKTKPLFYLSVGVETSIHPTHQMLMQQAKLIATRTPDWHKIAHLNSNVIYIPDIVYSLFQPTTRVRQPKSILVLPNSSISPKWNEPHWKHAIWEHFKIEMAQALDTLIESGHQVNFFPMCQNRTQNDAWTIAEILSKMQHSSQSLVLNETSTTSRSLLLLFSSYETVITQRYHGIILSEMTNTPYLAIHHHDKLKSSYFKSGSFTSYYGTYKDLILQRHKSLLPKKNDCVLPLERNILGELQDQVLYHLNG
jgi:polysaccharide pyruvyl transferase WcaK-like protein